MIKNLGIKNKDKKTVKWYHFDDTELNIETLKNYLNSLKEVSKHLEPNRSPLATETLHFDINDDIITVTDLKTVDVEKPSYTRGKRIGVMELNEKETLPPPEKYNIYINRRITNPSRMTSLIESVGGKLAIGPNAYHPLMEGVKFKNEKELRHLFHGAEYLRFPVIFLEDGHVAPGLGYVNPHAYIFFSKNQFRLANPMMKTAKREVIDGKIEVLFNNLIHDINAYIDNNVFCCTIVVTDKEEIQADVIDNIVANTTDELKNAIIGRTKIFEDEILDTINKISQPLHEIK